MGYEKATLEKLVTVVSRTKNLRGLRMFELGNQEIYGMEKAVGFLASFGYRPASTIVKYFFEFLGMRHTSVDYNGRDGAHRLDVRADITGHFPEKFDVLTNLGFTEHVGENSDWSTLLQGQYAVFKNLHDLGTANAIYYHCVPLTHNWYKHGVCDYSLEFFSELAAVCGYTIISGPFVEDYHVEKQASVFFQKTPTSSFPSFERFCQIPGLRSTESD
jgi:hypothetical protein